MSKPSQLALKVARFFACGKIWDESGRGLLGVWSQYQCQTPRWLAFLMLHTHSWLLAQTERELSKYLCLSCIKMFGLTVCYFLFYRRYQLKLVKFYLNTPDGHQRIMKKLDCQLNTVETGALPNFTDMEINLCRHIKEWWEQGGCITVGELRTRRE